MMRFNSNPRTIFFRSLKIFVKTPRKINAIIPALTVYAVWTIGIAYGQILGNSPEIALVIRQILAFTSSLFTFIFVYYWSKVILKRRNLLFWPIEYLGTIAISVIPILMYWKLTYDITNGSVLILYLRLIFLTVVTESIVGFLIFQIKSRSLELEQHQISLVTYEETFRATIFSHLHDKVQSRLFSVGIQLNQIKSDLNSDAAEKLEDIVAQIEKIRVLDVRKSSLEIVPPISPVGLTQSLLSLLKSHEPVLSGKLTMNLDTPLTDAEENYFGIGIYRIVEQALINSLIHGKATEVDVIISESDSELTLVIANNGRALEIENVNQGHGFAVIDGWVSKLKGEWTIFNKGRQVCLKTSFDRQISHV